PVYLKGVRQTLKEYIEKVNENPAVAARREAWLAIPPTQEMIDEAVVENAYRDEMATLKKNFESAENTRQEALDDAAEEARRDMLKTRIELARIEAQRKYYNERNSGENGSGILARLKNIFSRTQSPDTIPIAPAATDGSTNNRNTRTTSGGHHLRAA